jgi:hypothetical protein
MSLLEWVRKNRPNDLKVKDYINPKKEDDKRDKNIVIKKN